MQLLILLLTQLPLRLLPYLRRLLLPLRRLVLLLRLPLRRLRLKRLPLPLRGRWFPLRLLLPLLLPLSKELRVSKPIDRCDVSCVGLSFLTLS